MEKPTGEQSKSIIDYITFVDEIHVIPDDSHRGREVIVSAVSGIDPPAYEAIRREAERIRSEWYDRSGLYMGPDISVPLAIESLLDEHDLNFTQLLVDQLKMRRIPIWPTQRSARR